MDVPIHQVVNSFEDNDYILRRALCNWYDQMDHLLSINVYRDEDHRRSTAAERRFTRSHIKGLEALDKVLTAIKAFILRVQTLFEDYNMLLQQFAPESETFKLIDELENFIICIQRFDSVHEASIPFFHVPTLD